MRRNTIGLFLVAVSTILIGQSNAFGQSFSYGNFASTTGLSLKGGATQAANAVQLTLNGTGGTASAAWYTTPVNVQNPFSTTFNYTISPNGGADGIALVFQNDPNGINALGASGGGLGAHNLLNAFSVSLRTYVYNLIDLDSCGAGNPLQIYTLPGCSLGSASATLSGTHTVTVSYSGSAISVSLDSSPMITRAVNLPTAVAGTTAFIGVTGGTGAASETALLNSWSFATGVSAVPVPPSVWLTMLALVCMGSYIGYRSYAQNRA